jgi:hypothetical protein
MENTDILNSLIEVKLNNDEDFLLIKETLSRIGIASRNTNTLYPSCHILHKRGKFYIVHFKEMFLLDGKTANLSEEDIARRNTIARLLHNWGLCEIVGTENGTFPNKVEKTLPLSKLKILSYNEKPNWTISPKYNIGKWKRQK